MIDTLRPLRFPSYNGISSEKSEIRSEFFGDTPITVFADDREALSVARDLAEIKTSQGDNYPFFVMDMGRVEGLLNSWRINLPNVQPFYSLRCNSDPVLLRLLAEQGDIGFYCTSRNDVELALTMVSQDHILYANPVWTRGNLRHACENNIGMLVFENESELRRISVTHPNASLILRVCMNPPLNENAIRVGCEAFEEAPALLALAAREGLTVNGISFSIGAGTSSVGIYSHAIGFARRLFSVGASLGHNMVVLDIGGGFPGYSDATGPSFAQVAEAVSSALLKYFSDAACANVRIIAEPGRYFAASVFSLITNIIDKRIVDASLVTSDSFDSGSAGFVYQTNEGFYGSFGCRLTAQYEPCCRPLVDVDEDVNSYTYATILGPTLNSIDVVQSIARLPQMEVGEWLLWKDMGAYTLGNRETLGESGAHSPTVYYFVGNERWRQISRPSTPENILNSEKLIHVMTDSDTDSSHSTDCQSVGSADVESLIADDEPFWFCAKWLLDQEMEGLRR